MVQNTATGCGNDLPIFLVIVLFLLNIEKCQLFFFITLYEIILDKIGFYRIIYMITYYDIS